MDARCSRGADNPPANPLNFKLTHMLGCLRTIIIIMVPMITLMMKLFPIAPDDDEVCLAVLFFRHSPFFFFSFFPYQFAKLLMVIKDEMGLLSFGCNLRSQPKLRTFLVCCWCFVFYFIAWTEYAD